MELCLLGAAAKDEQGPAGNVSPTFHPHLGFLLFRRVGGWGQVGGTLVMCRLPEMVPG